MPLVYPVRLRTFSFFHLPRLPSALRPHSSPLLGSRKSVLWDGATLKVDDARRHPLLRGARRGENSACRGSTASTLKVGLWLGAWCKASRERRGPPGEVAPLGALLPHGVLLARAR